MSRYASILKSDDPRIRDIFDVEAETLHAGSILIDDPFPTLHRLRAEAPVHKGSLGEIVGYPDVHFSQHLQGFPTYTALSFAAVSQAFIDNATFSSHVHYKLPTVSALGETVLNKVGQEHRRYRGAIQPLFSPEAAQTWWDEKIIRETVEALIGNIEGKGHADLFLELCARMPVHVVSGAFGLDPEDIIPFRIAVTSLSSPRLTAAEKQDARQTVRRILRDVIAARRRQPQNDIISKLIEAEITLADGASRPFQDEEIIAHCSLIVLAGGGTTWRQLGITLFALLSHPEQFEQLKADRSLLPRVILEAARWYPTDLVFARLTTRDVELEGVTIPRDCMVHLCLGAANRDPTRWEGPDSFDIMRPVQRSLAFGGGPHSCLGQHVSRQEMEVALNAIIDRLPNLRWDGSKPRPKIIGGLFERGPSALPVLFDS
jgi:cytochrome P450